MTSRTRTFAASVATALGLVFLACAPAAVAAPKAPIADSDTSGYLGFCDQSGTQVRSGLIGAAPFAWKTVSSVAASENYAKGRAVIAVFQPRVGVEPGDWTGKQLTASSTFSNRKHPMVEGLRADAALADFTAVFPLRVHGLAQIRMYLSAPNTPMSTRPYAAVFVKVQGQRWTQVDGGKVDCSGGKATSNARQVLTKQQLDPTQSRPQPETAREAAAHGSRQAASGSGPSSRSSAAAPSAGGSAADGSVAARPVAEQRVDDSGGSTTLVAFGAILAAIVLVAAVFVVRHRRVAD